MSLSIVSSLFTGYCMVTVRRSLILIFFGYLRIYFCAEYPDTFYRIRSLSMYENALEKNCEIP